MPNIISGNLQGQQQLDLINTNYQYEYPDGLMLKPGTKLHDELVRKIMDRARESHNVIARRYDAWQTQDKFLTAYTWADEDEQKVVAADSRKPVSIVFPHSYAILETLLSYMMSAFFRDPIFRYEGYTPDDVIGSILMEQVVNLHCNKFKVMLNLMTMFRDSFTYGMGIVAPYWKSTVGGFQGNALMNVDPYLYLPDPNVPADQIQDGEYSGWIIKTNLMNLLTEETNNLDLFNVKYLKHYSNGRTMIVKGDPSARNLRSGWVESGNVSILNPVDVIPMYIKIIPKDWGLGNKDTPEQWLFKVAADTILISARPAAFKHQLFPVVTACPDTDGYSATPISRLEILSGLQGTLDWLFNSHIANVRKAINDVIIYDPYAINSEDLRDPKPGKLIRARRPIWGKGGLDQYVKQLNVNDITRANISDSGWIVDFMQKIGAVDDAAMGSLRSGGPDRLTKAEFQGTANGAVSRLERIAKIVGLQAMQDIGTMFAEHTQQMMDEDMYVKVTGDWQQILISEFGADMDRGRIRVSPDQLNIAYDVVVRDGSIPGGNFSESWIKLFEIMVQSPQLMEQFDVVRIFKHIARNSGARDVNEFVRRQAPQMTAMPDEQVEQNVQQGNLIPIGEAA